MMKNKLIKLAKDKGFYPDSQSTMRCHRLPDSYDSKSTVYYLWLCELQKWLIDKHGLIVLIYPTSKKLFYPLIKNTEDRLIWSQIRQIGYFNYETTLETGCYEALKLIE